MPNNSIRPELEHLFKKETEATTPSINIGLDLGTSYSKVVWRLGDEQVRPLCFSDNRLDLDDYLVPSLVSFNNGHMFWGFDAEEHPTTLVTNFKMCLATFCEIGSCKFARWNEINLPPELNGKEIRFITAYYLAELIAKIKGLIKKELEPEFGQSVVPKWTVNYAVPDSFIQNSEIAATFSEVFRTAWFMASYLCEHIECTEIKPVASLYMEAEKYAIESKELLSDEGFGCSPYPEIGAEVASILLNHNSEPGLYAFVDIGAGTIDASVFRYFRDSGDAKRHPYAAHIFDEAGSSRIETMASIDSGYPNPTGFPPQHLKWVKENALNFDKAERQKKYAREFDLLARAAKLIKKLTKEQMKIVQGNAYAKEKNIERWRDLKLILGGGGAALKTYKEAAKSGFTFYGRPHIVPNNLGEIPRPEEFDLQGLPPHAFLRLAVAYGLSHKISNLPEPNFCKDVAPLRPPRQNTKNHGSMYEK